VCVCLCVCVRMFVSVCERECVCACLCVCAATSVGCGGDPAASVELDQVTKREQQAKERKAAANKRYALIVERRLRLEASHKTDNLEECVAIMNETRTATQTYEWIVKECQEKIDTVKRIANSKARKAEQKRNSEAHAKVEEERKARYKARLEHINSTGEWGGKEACIADGKDHGDGESYIRTQCSKEEFIADSIKRNAWVAKQLAPQREYEAQVKAARDAVNAAYNESGKVVAFGHTWGQTLEKLSASGVIKDAACQLKEYGIKVCTSDTAYKPASFVGTYGYLFTPSSGLYAMFASLKNTNNATKLQHFTQYEALLTKKFGIPISVQKKMGLSGRWKADFGSASLNFNKSVLYVEIFHPDYDDLTKAALQEELASDRAKADAMVEELGDLV